MKKTDIKHSYDRKPAVTDAIERKISKVEKNI